MNNDTTSNIGKFVTYKVMKNRNRKTRESIVEENVPCEITEDMIQKCQASVDVFKKCMDAYGITEEDLTMMIDKLKGDVNNGKYF